MIDATVGGWPVQTRNVVSFGHFNLVPSERLLMKEGVAVALGARALDTLIALTSHPNEIMGKADLMARVWPDVTIEESSLRFHIAGLRKALGDGKDGARYIATMTGRGYCFVAPISLVTTETPGTAPMVAADPGSNLLPSRLERMVGRAGDVATLSAQLAASRFVTIVGSGGVGKTTAAIAVAHEMLAAFAGAVIFVDLGILRDPRMTAAAVASMLELPVRSDDPTHGLIAYLRDKHILIVLDNCEHVVEAAASMTAQIFQAASQVHILATSREPLKVEGEYVHRLAPLAFPPDDPRLTAEVALTFPAPQLFVERAKSSGAHLDLDDADAALVAGICRKLDGVALAIELAAGRVEAYGLEQTAALLDQRLTLMWQGQRSAPPRQRTLQATLDWSYGLLSKLERSMLCRLAVFLGHFPLEAARAVVTSDGVDEALVIDAIDSLVAKSLVATHRVGAKMRYRLPDTTRTYALEIGIADAERNALAARHAIYYRQCLEQSRAALPNLPGKADRLTLLADLANVRSALEWCFSANGDADIGVSLAVTAAPVFLAMSLTSECQRWSERAIAAVEHSTQQEAGVEMALQAALGISLIYTEGGSERAGAALLRSLALAEKRGDLPNQQLVLGSLYFFHVRVGEIKAALHCARQGYAISETIGSAAMPGFSGTLLGDALSLNGDLDGARGMLEAVLWQDRHVQKARAIYLGFDHHLWARSLLARTLWLQGFPAQALDRALSSIDDATRLEHPVTLAMVLREAITVLLWRGDLDEAEERIDGFMAHAASFSYAPYLAIGLGFRGELAIRRGDTARGIVYLETCLRNVGYKTLTTAFSLSLVQALAQTQQIDKGMMLIEQAIRLIEVSGDLSYMPEAIRVKGNLLLALPEPASDNAETCFVRSLQLSRQYRTTAWELRAATNLAALFVLRGRHEHGRAILRPVFDRFGEGRDTADLAAAERVLATSSQHSHL